MVVDAASATALMLAEMLVVPSVMAWMLELTSAVVALCSSTAPAMVVEVSLTRSMSSEISAMACTASMASCWIVSIFDWISPVALAVCEARAFTSLATTAKPLPASPTRAASMVALRASRSVCSAIEVITLTTLPMSEALASSFSIRSRVRLDTSTALAVVRAASAVLSEISRTAALI